METTLPAEAASVRKARNIVMARLIDAGCTIDTIEAARLVTSELASNAVRHASGDHYVLVVDVDGDVLHVEVRDDDPHHPVRQEHPEESGRGMWLVDGLARRWGVEPVPPGKSVWFEMPCAAVA